MIVGGDGLRRVDASESRVVITLTKEENFISIFLPHHLRASELKINLVSQSVSQSTNTY